MKIDTSEFKKLASTSKRTIRAEVIEPAAVYFHDITPVRTGNARRKTRLANDTVIADYPYAERLDDGYSKQAPQGMTTPTEKEIIKLVNKFVNKLGK
jgi:hypothetical protein